MDPNQYTDDKIKSHLHDGNYSQRVNFFDLFGNIDTVTAVPTAAPSDIYGQMKIYYNAGAGQWSLYMYDYVANVWVRFSTVTTSGGPAGSDTQVVFNDGGAFGADADFVWNKTTNVLTITGTVAATTVTATTIVASSSVSTPLIITASGSLTITPASGGNILLNAVVLATNATTGFPVIPTCAGTPTGAATKGAMIYDTTGNKLWIYNAAWKFVALA